MYSLGFHLFLSTFGDKLVNSLINSMENVISFSTTQNLKFSSELPSVAGFESVVVAKVLSTFQLNKVINIHDYACPTSLFPLPFSFPRPDSLVASVFTHFVAVSRNRLARSLPRKISGVIVPSK